MIELDNLHRIGIGTWGIAGYLHFDDEVDSIRQLTALKHQFDLGANYIDCSLKYADGSSLEVVKQLIEYAGRDNIFISAKLEKFIESEDDIESQLTQYLRALSIDSIDLLQLHAPSFTRIGIEQTYVAVAKHIHSGRVRYAGASNFSVEQLQQAERGLGRKVAVHESLFNFTFRQNEDAGILSYCLENGIQFVAYQPLHRGKTESRYSELLVSLSNKYNKSQPAIIINWLIRKGMTPLIRSDNIQHLDENFDALNFTMDDRDYTTIDTYRDPLSNGIDVDWEDSGKGSAVYQIANLR